MAKLSKDKIGLGEIINIHFINGVYKCTVKVGDYRYSIKFDGHAEDRERVD